MIILATSSLLPQLEDEIQIVGVGYRLHCKDGDQTSQADLRRPLVSTDLYHGIQITKNSITEQNPSLIHLQTNVT